MTFLDTVLASAIAGLAVLAVASSIAWILHRARSPRVVFCSLGDTSSPNEREARWYHGAVFSESKGSVAMHPQLAVRKPGSSDFEDWFFAEHLSGTPQPVAIRSTRLRIPLIAGNVSGNHAGVCGSTFPPRTWAYTPNGTVGGPRIVAQPYASLTFTVKVTWMRNGAPAAKQAEYRLKFGALDDEPEFSLVVRRWRGVFPRRS